MDVLDITVLAEIAKKANNDLDRAKTMATVYGPDFHPMRAKVFHNAIKGLREKATIAENDLINGSKAFSKSNDIMDRIREGADSTRDETRQTLQFSNIVHGPHKPYLKSITDFVTLLQSADLSEVYGVCQAARAIDMDYSKLSHTQKHAIAMAFHEIKGNIAEIGKLVQKHKVFKLKRQADSANGKQR